MNYICQSIYKYITSNMNEPIVVENFLTDIIEQDIKTGRIKEILTRFPPEPNGFLHLGHAKSICLNFGLAKKYNGKTNLRFDDTNPSTEETQYVNAIKDDIRWLGFMWAQEYYASDYFETLFQYAVTLINKGLAYIDDSTPDEIAKQKGTPTEPGKRNQYAERTVVENLKLFEDMRAGKFPDGAKTLRAKIDIASPNMLLRDPILYRIKHAHHHRTGNKWCIYPMYDFAHGQSDSIEHITHSICTLEFVEHRPLYEWFIKNLEIYPSKQYEFARLNLTYTVMSKRKLLQLVNEKKVDGWDDPRMPTISGLRRRGYTPESIHLFCEKIGVAKRNNLIDVSLLEFCVREHLNKISLRRMVVLKPIKVTITNLEQDELLETEDNPEDTTAGKRRISFTRELYIEADDFMEHPPKKYFRLSVGQKVRLKSAYIIECQKVIKDDQGNITDIQCVYFPNSKSGQDSSGISVKGTLHWVSCKNNIPIQVQLFDRLFIEEDMDNATNDLFSYLNPNAKEIITHAYAEKDLAHALPEQHFQFVRNGYFVLDKDSKTEKMIFNRTVGLKDSWAKISKG